MIAGRTDPAHAPETLRALRFGEAASRASLIGSGQYGLCIFLNTHPILLYFKADLYGNTCSGTSAATPDAAEALRALREELASVQAEIARTETWQDGKPVGAEALRERMESLLATQRALTGGSGASSGSDSGPVIECWLNL